MLSLDAALQHLLRDARLTAGEETLDLIAAHGRILAKPQISNIDVPPHAVSAMDGYAFNQADAAQLTTDGLAISQRIAAGHPPQPLTRGTAARIFTGSEIPSGADTVVIQEDCESANGRVICRELPPLGAHVRARGQDISRGSELIAAGSRLRAQDLGLLASAGIAQVPVRRRLNVGVLATGDELTEPGQELRAGKIYNSNRFTLCGLLNSLGVTPVYLGQVADDVDETEKQLLTAARQCDAIISTGGVSVGEEDHVRKAVEKLGALSLWKIAIKPGKPFAYGRIDNDESDGKPFFGLPGNPVAVFVTFLLLVRPYLLAMQGVTDLHPKTLRLPADFTVATSSVRREFIRARIDQGRVQRFSSQDSGVLSSTHWADALAVIPEHATVANGDPVEVIPLDQFYL